MSDRDIGEAARHYREGDSLGTVGLAFNVDAATVRRELHRAGVAIRPRPGWSGSGRWVAGLVGLMIVFLTGQALAGTPIVYA